jgi:transcriptional regulator GlxA family with amidase domain
MPHILDGASAVATVADRGFVPDAAIPSFRTEGPRTLALARPPVMSIRLARPEPPVPEDDGMERVMSHLREHFREDVPMKALADLVRLSLRQFHRNFKKRFGLPPNQYLIRMRVMAARDLLVTENRPIADIAYALGFADDTLFIRQFKSRMGMTPLQYRKSRR